MGIKYQRLMVTTLWVVLSVSLQTYKSAVAAKSEAYSGKSGWQINHVLLRRVIHNTKSTHSAALALV